MEGSVKDKIESTRHKEVLDALGKILSKDNGVVKVIQQNTETASQIIKKLELLKFPEFPKIEIPSPNVTVNNDSNGELLSDLKEQIGKMLVAIENQNQYLEQMCIPKEYDFNVIRDTYGNLKSVKATPKMITKSKYQA